MPFQHLVFCNRSSFLKAVSCFLPNTGFQLFYPDIVAEKALE